MTASLRAYAGKVMWPRLCSRCRWPCSSRAA